MNPATGRRMVLSIGNSHDNGAALFDGDRLLAAVNEERLDRVKYSWAYPPRLSIREVIRLSGVAPQAITDLVISGMDAPRLAATMAAGFWEDWTHPHGAGQWLGDTGHLPLRLLCVWRACGYRAAQDFLKKNYGVRPRLHFVPHHLCHAASAYRTAPFDDALVVTADGEGDDTALTISEGRGGKLTLLHQIRYPHSFGQFYAACTQLLGFTPNRHEGKITGLSGFGNASGELYEKIRGTIRRSGPGFELDKRFYTEGWVRGFSRRRWRETGSLGEALDYRNYKPTLQRLVGNARREDVAAVFQRLLEEEMFQVVEPFVRQTGLKNLALSGGVFANVKLNTALFRQLGMERIYIFPHMGDGGLPIGGALEVLEAKPKSFDHVYWGPAYAEDEIRAALEAEPRVRFERSENIHQAVAERLAKRQVVARFDGAMEFGPRALGNRSILCHAGDAEVNRTLNRRLGRTEFMPFAPIVLADRARELFEGVDGAEHALKFMTLILHCTDWTKKNCPAVVHVDGTARPQCVDATINPGMTELLRRYEKLTGIPVLVNTSFNMHEEPIVCSPRDAVRAFCDSGVDVLAAGPFVVSLSGC